MSGLASPQPPFPPLPPLPTQTHAHTSHLDRLLAFQLAELSTRELVKEAARMYVVGFAGMPPPSLAPSPLLIDGLLLRNGSIYATHDEIKDKEFELELSWVGEGKLRHGGYMLVGEGGVFAFCVVEAGLTATLAALRQRREESTSMSPRRCLRKQRPTPRSVRPLGSKNVCMVGAWFDSAVLLALVGENVGGQRRF